MILELEEMDLNKNIVSDFTYPLPFAVWQKLPYDKTNIVPNT